MIMDMNASSSRSSVTRLTTIVWHLAILSLPLLVRAQYSNNPSTDWALSDFYNSPGNIQAYRYTDLANLSTCNNGSSNLELLNDAQGLYGRPTSIISYHYPLPYTVYFRLYFVIPADNVCMKDNAEHNESIAAYYLSLVALNAYGKIQDPNKGQVVWTANPTNPVTKNACLLLNDTILELVDYANNSATTVWNTSTGAASNVSFAISYEGNLALFSNTTDKPYTALWESFGYPADTLMVLQVLEKQSTLSSNSLSSNSSASSNSGNYTLALEKGRLVLYARIWQEEGDGESPHGSPYWVWPYSSDHANNDVSFAAFCWNPVQQLRLIAGSNRSSNVSSGYRGMVSPEFCTNISSSNTISNNNYTVMEITGLNQSIEATFATFLRLEADGDLRAYTVDNTTYPGSDATWRAFFNVFDKTPCALPLYCGFYGKCVPREGDGSYCICNYSHDPKLVFADASNSKDGCKPENDDVAQLWDMENMARSRSGEAVRCATLENIVVCSSAMDCKIELFEVNNVDYFSLNLTDSKTEERDSDACRGNCEKNCSCTAAFWDQSNVSCFLVLGRLGTIQQGTRKAFIKYVKMSPSSTSSKIWKVVGPVLATALLVVSVSLAFWRRRRAEKMNELQKEGLLLLSLLEGANTEQFTWKQMHEYTCGFSDLLGGGGFGRVFRGALPDGTAIAVKQLDDQGQGNKEFIAEVSILSRIHHAHLVRLIGFCSEGMHRLLVYEYMENGSLDAWLFKNHVPSASLQEHHDTNEKGKGKGLLPWKTRFQITLGTAKGLAYLHEECEERVIHMDLKPQNILLGRNFLPKISDFGMSRRTSREQSSVMTVMRGTPGYLAPEWLLDCSVTEKCDVYSFGIVLLELVSGRKVKDVRAVKQKLSMRALKESVMLEFLDEGLRNDTYGSHVNAKEAVRMVEVALSCARRDPTKRPAMSKVAMMLEGREEVVQDVYELDDDAGEQQLVMYPSAMNRTMRLQQQELQGKLDSFMSSSLTASRGERSSSGSSSNNYIWSSSDNNNYSEKKTKRYSRNQLKTKASSSSSSQEEWDRLL